MPDFLNIPTQPIIQLIAKEELIKKDSDLIYTKGGGLFFSNILKNDIVKDGNQLHGGNPILTDIEIPKYKVDNKVSVSQETIKVESGFINRGLFLRNNLTNDKLGNDYFWDEVYTSPIGFQSVTTASTIIGTSTSLPSFSINGNLMELITNDVNIIPKIGDYIILQKVSDVYDYSAFINSDTISYTDGYSNLPVINSTESYQFKIINVAIGTFAGKNTPYSLVLDKSINLKIDDVYTLILLNRKDTGLEKELFYETFEQIEVHRSQLLGDPYNNTNISYPLGRKNFINYNNAQYLGIKNLLFDVLNKKNSEFTETPFLIFDINNEIRDAFSKTASSTNNLVFEFHLPLVMFNEDINNKLNILTDSGGALLTNENLGDYRTLTLANYPGKTFGYIFYDLRIVVIDDAELVLAMSYNSNRNFTLPKPNFYNPGNQMPKNNTNLNFDVIGCSDTSTGGAAYILINGTHNLNDGDSVLIQDVKVKLASGIIQNSTVNGIKYIKRYFTDPLHSLGELKDRFYLYDDSGLTSGTVTNGTFYFNGIGNSGKIKGDELSYDYFITYRVKTDRYNSILPYADIQSFNFSTLNGKVDNVFGNLYFEIPKINWQYNSSTGEGFQLTDLELIIGKWENNDINNPNKITGITNVVVISCQEVGSLPSSILPALDIELKKSIYNDAVYKIGNGLGPYDYDTNKIGDPTYDLKNNLLHYNITSGTLSNTFNTAEGIWTLGNIKYKTEVEQYRSKIKVVVGSDEWNDTMNPSYDSNNILIKNKYISEIAITDKNSDKPLIYAKIAPPIRKVPNLDLVINLSIDF